MTTIKLRRGTAAQWTTVNPVLAQGEPGFETDTGKHKIGNGIAAWTGLKYYVDEMDLSNAVAGEVSARDAAINTAVSNLINGAPTALNTLLEISAQLANDESAVSALVGSIASHVADQNNPHVVTKAQVGLGNVPNIDTTAAIATAVSTIQFIDFDPDGVPFIETGVSPALNVDTAVANYIGAPGGPSQIDTKLAGSYTPMWKPLTTYAAGTVVMAPDGSIVKKLTTGVSGSSYTSTDWQTVSTVNGTQAATELNNIFAQVIGIPAGSSGAQTQAILDAAPIGSVVWFAADLTLTTPLTVNKALTIEGNGHTVTVVTNIHCLDITSSDVKINRLNFIGPGASVTNYASYGMTAYGASATSRISRIRVTGCRFSSFGGAAFEGKWVSDVLVTDNIVEDVAYAGFMFLSGSNCRVINNILRRVNFVAPAATAYGVAFTANSSNQTTDPRSTDCVASGNTIEDCNWEPLDTHAGQRIVFSGNVVKNSLRGVVVVPNATQAAQDVTITGNVIDGQDTTGSRDAGILVVGPSSGGEVVTATITGNTVRQMGGVSNTTGAIMFYYTRGVTVQGNTIIEPSGAGGIVPYHFNTGFTITGNVIIDPWSASYSGVAAIHIRDTDNSGIIEGNDHRAGSKTATNLNVYGLRFSFTTNNDVLVGANNFAAAATKVYQGTTTVKWATRGVAPVVAPAATDDLKASLVAAGIITAGGATPLDLGGGVLSNAVVNGNFRAKDQGLIAWVCDPAYGTISNQTAIVSGTQYISRLTVDQALAVGKVQFAVGLAGTSITEASVDLYNATGTQIATADVATTIASTGAKQVSFAVATGVRTIGETLYVGFRATFSGTAAQLRGISTSAFGNMQLVAANARFATMGTGITSPLVSFTPASLSGVAVGGQSFWFGLAS